MSRRRRDDRDTVPSSRRRRDDKVASPSSRRRRDDRSVPANRWETVHCADTRAPTKWRVELLKQPGPRGQYWIHLTRSGRVVFAGETRKNKSQAWETCQRLVSSMLPGRAVAVDFTDLGNDELPNDVWGF